MNETLKKYLITGGIAVGIGIGIILLAFLWLRFFTNHGEEFSVPDFRGLTIPEVTKLAEEHNLNFRVSDVVYSAPGKPGAVVEQIPPKDFMVKENRTIFLTIKSLKAEQVPMPSLTKVSLYQAKADIGSNFLRIGKLIYRPSKTENLVLDQQINGKSIAVGEMVPKGTKIDLVLGKKRGMDKTHIPDLIGLSLTDAEFKAAGLFINLGKVNYDETVISYEDSTTATVRRQTPAKNTKVSAGAEVKIWMSMMSDNDSTETPKH